MKALLYKIGPLNWLIYRLTGWGVNAYGSYGDGHLIGIYYHWKREDPNVA